jgi:hypothetical protein
MNSWLHKLLTCGVMNVKISDIQAFHCRRILQDVNHLTIISSYRSLLVRRIIAATESVNRRVELQLLGVCLDGHISPGENYSRLCERFGFYQRDRRATIHEAIWELWLEMFVAGNLEAARELRSLVE